MWQSCDEHTTTAWRDSLNTSPSMQTQGAFVQTIIFDVETGPLADSELSALLPPFDPAEVKTGNLKDPSKIAEKIAEAEANHRRDFFDKAALDPLTGRVVAIGMLY